MDDKQYLSEKQIRTYFTSINTELGYSNHGECAFLCPIHGDNTASASFNLDKQVWYCHACGVGGDLYEMEKYLCPDDPFPVIKERIIAICKGQARPEAVKVSFATKELKEKKYRPVTNDVTCFYNAIIDEKEKHKYAITRYHYDDNPTEKTFRAWYAKDGKQVWGAPKDFPLIPYRLPELQKAQIVFIVEGEKCVDTFRKAIIDEAITATCNPFGAGKWEDSYSKHLQDKVVVILPDNDEPGRKHAEQVAASAHQYAKLVKIGHVPLEGEGSDIADLIESIAGKQAEYTAEQKQAVLDAVMGILKKSKPWEPKIEVTTPEPNDAEETDIPAMPKTAMYGILADMAVELMAPLGWAYPALLASSAALGIPQLSSIRPTVYVSLLGPKGGGKSTTGDRAIKSTPNLDLKLVCKFTTGSDRGLFETFGKEEFKGQTILLTLDEMSKLMKKVNIMGSALPETLCTLFYKDEDGGSDKKGSFGVNIRLNILGGLICKDPDDFLKAFGANTTDGLADRFIYGMAAGGEKFDPDTFNVWQPKFAAIHPVGCTFSSNAHELATAWRKAGEKDGKDRMRLAELAKRVALISSSMNHNTEVGEQSMQAALIFMEWQEKIRSIYQPSEAITLEGKIAEAILKSLKPVVMTKWSTLCRNKNLYKKYGARLVAQVREFLVKEGQITYDKQKGVTLVQ